MTHPRNMTAVEGQRVLFNCGAEAFPDNITYYWYKDNKDVRQLPVYNKRLTLTEGKLLLTGVVKEDMGWYTCRPSNGIGQDEASAYLNVTCEYCCYGSVIHGGVRVCVCVLLLWLCYTWRCACVCVCIAVTALLYMKVCVCVLSLIHI